MHTNFVYIRTKFVYVRTDMYTYGRTDAAVRTDRATAREWSPISVLEGHTRRHATYGDSYILLIRSFTVRCHTCLHHNKK